MSDATATEKQPRTRGTGGLFTRPGSKNIYISYYGLDGKQHQESAKTEIMAVAERLLRKRLEEVEKGGTPHEARKLKYEDIRAMLVTDYRNRGVGMLEKRKNKETGAMEDHVDGFQHLDPFFKGMSVLRIATPLLQKFVEKRKKDDPGIENGTVNRNLALLRKMMNLARQANLIQTVPHFPMLAETNVREGFVEVEDFKKILERLPAHLRPLAIFLYYTGCRVGAAKQVTWDMVSGDCKMMTLPGRIVKNKQPITLVMPSELVPVLKSQFRVSGRPVFSDRNLRKEWEKAAPGVLIHDLRRSGVRNLVNGGVSQTVAMKISGHKTDSVFRRYAIVSTDDIAKAMEKVNANLDCGTMGAAAGRK